MQPLSRRGSLFRIAPESFNTFPLHVLSQLRSLPPSLPLRGKDRPWMYCPSLLSVAYAPTHIFRPCSLARAILAILLCVGLSPSSSLPVQTCTRTSTSLELRCALSSEPNLETLVIYTVLADIAQACANPLRCQSGFEHFQVGSRYGSSTPPSRPRKSAEHWPKPSVKTQRKRGKRGLGRDVHAL